MFTKDSNQVPYIIDRVCAMLAEIIKSLLSLGSTDSALALGGLKKELAPHFGWGDAILTTLSASLQKLRQRYCKGRLAVDMYPRDPFCEEVLAAHNVQRLPAL